MEQSFNLLFYLKKSKHHKSSSIPIYLRIGVDGIDSEISTKLEADPVKWSAQANRVTGKSDATKAVNDYLDILYTKAINARTKLTELGKPITATNVKLLVQGKSLELPRTIMPIFK